MVPPFFFEILISLKSQLVSFLSTIDKTAFTASGDKTSLLEATTFEDNEVETHPINYFSSSSCIGIEHLFKYIKACYKAS